MGAIAIVIAAVMLGFSTIHGGSMGAARVWRNCCGDWGEFDVGDDVCSVSQGVSERDESAVVCDGVYGGGAGDGAGTDAGAGWRDSIRRRSSCSICAGVLFWLFLGGFVWVIGDLFQQFAAKYLGIGRGIPLSNTNQLWGLAWGALVFGELAGADRQHMLLVIGGSVMMILGALAISTAVASAKENSFDQRGGAARVQPLWPGL